MKQEIPNAEYFAEEYLKENPTATLKEAHLHGFSLATSICLAAHKVAELKKSIDKEDMTDAELKVNKVSRVELIDEKGRSYTNWKVFRVWFHLQDEGRTLKIFIN
jgi:hypothetical protein